MKFLALLLCFIPVSAYAYLDPASGSALFYLIITIVSSTFFLTKRYFIDFIAKIRTMFSSQEATKKEASDIVFYSEGAHYWQVFAPIIEQLCQQNQKVLYLTSAKNDEGLQYENPMYSANYIGSPLIACSYLNNLKTKFLGLTAPQLDVFNLKKTKNIKHYAHIIHAPIDIHLYRKFAFDYFDSVFCSGPHQLKSLEALEKTRRTPKKELFRTGLTYLDYLKEKKESLPQSTSDKKTILIAPSWKDHCILNLIGSDLIDSLIGDDFHILLRPHPQTYSSFPHIIKNIEDRFSSRIEIDRSQDPLYALNKCDILISDLSGIIWDFIYLFDKPIILFDPHWDLKGFEGTEIEHLAWDIRTIQDFIPRFSKQDLSLIREKVKNLLVDFDSKNYQQVRSESLFNSGESAKIAAKQIQEILAQL